MKTVDLSGTRFGRLFALRAIAGSRLRPRRWECACDCGKTTEVITRDLIDGHTSSCGCLHRERAGMIKASHGQRDSASYVIWKGMNQRCSNPKSPRYSDYGGRGITVCAEWRHDFMAFLRDMGERPFGLTLERKKNDLGYSPDNCIWATYEAQAANRRQRSNSVIITSNGRTMTLAEWSRELKTSSTAIQGRIRRGMSPSEAVTVEIKRKRVA